MEDGNTNKISYIIEGEIARLRKIFVVDLDPAHHNQSKCVHLLCKLGERFGQPLCLHFLMTSSSFITDCSLLPAVPPITVIVPENYPEGSPSCNLNSNGYDASPYLQKVRDMLKTGLASKTHRYCITGLLNDWVTMIFIK